MMVHIVTKPRDDRFSRFSRWVSLELRTLFFHLGCYGKPSICRIIEMCGCSRFFKFRIRSNIGARVFDFNLD